MFHDLPDDIKSYIFKINKDREQKEYLNNKIFFNIVLKELQKESYARQDGFDPNRSRVWMCHLLDRLSYIKFLRHYCDDTHSTCLMDFLTFRN